MIVVAALERFVRLANQAAACEAVERINEFWMTMGGVVRVRLKIISLACIAPLLYFAQIV